MKSLPFKAPKLQKLKLPQDATTVPKLDITDGQFPVAGFYKDLLKKIRPVPAEKVTTSHQAAKRLLSLKKKVNELQKRRQHYWKRQAVRSCALVASAGSGIIVTSFVAVYQHRRLTELKQAIADLIGQINELRRLFATEEDPEWARIENKVRVDRKIFIGGIGRHELEGEL